MVVRGIGSRWFAPENGDGASYQIVPLDGVQYLDIFAASEGDVFKLSGKICESILGVALVGWKDQVDQNGDAVDFSVDLIRYLSPEDLSSVAAEILSISTLKDDEVKNS